MHKLHHINPHAAHLHNIREMGKVSPDANYSLLSIVINPVIAYLLLSLR